MSLSSSTNSLPYSTDKGGYSTHDTLVLFGIGFCVTSVCILVLVLCECLCCRLRRRRGAAGGTVLYVATTRPPFFVQHGGGGGGAAAADGLSPSAVAALPSFAYHRGLLAVAGGGGRGWAQCAVCLSLLQEGEVVRRLPACTHLFHVCCIDMWLRSHSTCPLCRATVEPTKESSTSKMQVLASGVV